MVLRVDPKEEKRSAGGQRVAPETRKSTRDWRLVAGEASHGGD